MTTPKKSHPSRHRASTSAAPSRPGQQALTKPCLAEAAASDAILIESPGDPADRQDVLTRIALGESAESAAKQIGVPLSLVEKWLSDPKSHMEIGELRSGFSQSLAANGASVVSTALEVLDEALSSGKWDDSANMAAKLVMSSGVMGRVFVDPTNQLDTQVRLREQANRLAFLDKLKAMDMTEEEWNIMMRPTPTGSAPRSRTTKKRN